MIEGVFSTMMAWPRQSAFAKASAGTAFATTGLAWPKLAEPAKAGDPAWI
jgi:hypothetical protein